MEHCRIEKSDKILMMKRIIDKTTKGVNIEPDLKCVQVGIGIGT
jgi:hypothetical protein